MSDSRLRRVVRCLWLWNVDNSTGHAANEDHSSRGLALHQVLSYRNCKQIRAIHVDAPKLSDTFDGIIDSFEVLGESCRSDQVVDLAVLLNNLGDDGFDGVLGRDIGVMCSDFGGAARLLACCT